MEMTLEREFTNRKMSHIVVVLRAMLIKYYEVTLAKSPQLPSFMGGDTPEKCADKEIEHLYNTDLNKFLDMYEKAYQELAQLGDF